MLKHILKRLAIAVFVLLAFSFVLYGIMYLLTFMVFGRWGLNFFGSYFRWLGYILRGDLGYSTRFQMPVADVLLDHMWYSFVLIAVSTVIAYVIAIPIGFRAGTKQYSKFDFVSSTLVLIGISFPVFFLAPLFIRLLSVELGWFPVSGVVSGGMPADVSEFERFLDRVWHTVLPILTMTIINIGGLMRHIRINAIEVMQNDYIRTARSMGLNERSIVYKHAFKNTAIPMTTFLTGVLPMIFAGNLIVEQIFGFPGIGFMAFRALRSGDLNLFIGYTMFIGVLTVIGVLIADIVYVAVDPRVRMN